MRSTRSALLKLALIATLLSVLAVLSVSFGAKEVREALKRGYVDVGIKRNSRSSEYAWKTRHAASERPWRFYASLVRWVSLPLFLLMAACLAWLRLLQLLRTGNTKLVGCFRTVSAWIGVVAALAGICTLFFWIPLN